MAEDSGQEKTEQATTRRREENRKKGQVAKSPEVNSAVMLLVGFSVLMIFRKHFNESLSDMFVGIYSISPTYSLSLANTRLLFMNVLWQLLLILLPLFIAMGLAAILVNIAQVGFLFTGEPLVPKLDKINPIQGFKRLFSRRTAETLLRDIVKIILVVWIGYTALMKIMPQIMEMTDYPVGQILSFGGHSVFSIAMKILIGYGVLAVLDYAFQRWDYEKSMMMTRQEIKEELRQSEGDPLLRARVRSVQREIARRRMMDDVEKAAVVITNPTEYAIALSYEAGMAAPVVVAKGRKLIAEKIKKIALENSVPIVENRPLAQSLYKAVDIGGAIPEELFTAVAEVLAYVFRLKNKKVL